MTGTGACVFAVFDEKTQAVQAKQALVGRFDGFIARGVDVSPLSKLLNRLTNSPNKR
jgi:4-diphosphocytidyl-2-C-methyl-D-erythritol kinase